MKKLLFCASVATSFLFGTMLNINETAFSKMYKSDADVEVYKDKKTGCEYLIATNETMRHENYSITPRYFKEKGYATPHILGCKSK